MATIIDREKCTNCKTCYERCPEGLFGLDAAGRVTVSRPDECWLCGSCEMDCPAGAITVTYDVDTGPIFLSRREGA
jgi:NAD-dependent dihydropyrimidine dehydrogenase PreA subunit